MKKFILLSCGISIYIHSNAQQITQQVINSSGNTFSTNNFSITSNIGESLTKTLSNSQTIITQGFIQPFNQDVPTSLVHLKNLDGNFTLYPSLVSDVLYCDFIDVTITCKGFEIYNSLGQLVLKKSRNFK